MANFMSEFGRAIAPDLGQDIVDYLGRKFGALPETALDDVAEPLAGIGHNNPPPEFKMPTALGALQIARRSGVL